MSHESNCASIPMHIEDAKDADVRMAEATVKRSYTTYTDQDKVRFFKLMFEKVKSASVAAKQLGIHHKKVILDYIDGNPSAVLDQLIERLLSKSTLYGNSEAKIQERLEWAHKWEKTDMDFRKNCVFLDEFAFHINMKRSMAWSKKGTPAVVTVPKTRARTTTILANKRKRGIHAGLTSTGTVTGHYLSFLKATMDEMDKYPHMKGHYLVMDNAPIHKSDDISKYVESRGYRCTYLPLYSPELNPIEQFWSVVKSKVKRNRLLENETPMTRISEASNSISTATENIYDVSLQVVSVCILGDHGCAKIF
ncbi:hypothetical protein VTP01DRAFT_5121 [Rhizomucor pusillus]|uniref:uncharacterized protein n=1 Tax=Rhizomucor pusillus TaxID=4840 RepID=UPI0037434B2C